MKETFKIVIVLTFVCIVCSFFLSLAFNSAKQKISLNEKKLIEESIIKISPLTKKIKNISGDSEDLYQLKDKHSQLNGYAFIASGQGYQGTIKILAVSDTSFNKLTGIEIIEAVETPGLGAKIAEAPFLNQFKGLNVSLEISCTKKQITEDNQIEAITGATISSNAVTRILNNRLAEIKEQLKKSLQK